MTFVPGHVPPVQVNDVAAGVQLAVRVAVPPAMTEVGDAVRVQAGGAAPIWHACQFVPVAASQAESVAATPLEVKLLVQSALCPAVKVVGGVGTGPVNWLLLTRKDVKAVNPVREGIDPDNWLKVATKDRKFVKPVSDGIGPVRKLVLPKVPLTSIFCNAVNPARGGIAPVNWLVLTKKNCNADNPVSVGIVPVNWLLPT